MSTLAYIIIFSFIGSIVSLAGGVLLLFKEKFARKISHYLASFAAGTLLGTAFFDLLPEALDANGEKNIFLFTIIGILVFFLMERFLIHWFHHHGEMEESGRKAVIPLIVLGDSIHNFIDGVAIAATFLVDIKLGIITSLAVAAHEIPQEIGDFGLMLHKGIPKRKVLFINVFSALVALIGALLVYFLGGSIKQILPIALSVTAGFFIYISLSDLIPEIHLEEKRSIAFGETILLLIGVFVVWIFVTALEG